MKYKSFYIENFCKVEKGKFPTQKTPKGKYPLVVTAEERKTAPSYQFNTSAVCIPLVSSTGHGHASINRIQFQNGKFALANIMVALIPNPKICNPKYLYYLLSKKKDEYLIPLMRGSANVSLGVNEIKKVKVFLPISLSDQDAVVNILDKAQEIKNRSEKLCEFTQMLTSNVLEYEES